MPNARQIGNLPQIGVKQNIYKPKHIYKQIGDNRGIKSNMPNPKNRGNPTNLIKHHKTNPSLAVEFLGLFVQNSQLHRLNRSHHQSVRSLGASSQRHHGHHGGISTYRCQSHTGWWFQPISKIFVK